MSANQATVLERVLDALGYADAGMAKAAAVIDGLAETRKKIDELAPAVVDALIEHGRIHTSEKAAAAAALHDHVQTVEMLGRLATQRNAQEQPLGTPLGTKEAGSGASAFAGTPVNSIRASDAALLRGLGIPLPS